MTFQSAAQCGAWIRTAPSEMLRQCFLELILASSIHGERSNRARECQVHIDTDSARVSRSYAAEARDAVSFRLWCNKGSKSDRRSLVPSSAWIQCQCTITIESLRSLSTEDFAQGPAMPTGKPQLWAPWLR